MAIAVSMLLGFTISENFKQPYFSLSIADFWHRWHISLSTWLRDYVYIPLGGSRYGKIRKYINILATFLVSGLWHGVGLNYLCWGLLNGIGNVIEDTRKSAAKIRGGETKLYRIWKRVGLFLYATILWVLFRSESLIAGMSYLKRILMEFRPWELTDGTLFELGIDRAHMGFLIVCIGFAAYISILREKGFTSKQFCEKNVLIKCSGFLVLLTAIVSFGNYGPGIDSLQFIYAGF